MHTERSELTKMLREAGLGKEWQSTVKQVGERRLEETVIHRTNPDVTISAVYDTSRMLKGNPAMEEITIMNTTPGKNNRAEYLTRVTNFYVNENYNEFPKPKVDTWLIE